MMGCLVAILALLVFGVKGLVVLILVCVDVALYKKALK